jgi:hypothetical protein
MGGQSRTKRDRRRAQPDALTQMMRPACTQCGQPVEWLTTEQAAAGGIDLTAALAFFDLPPGQHPDVWACTGCSEYGVMGDIEPGFV